MLVTPVPTVSHSMLPVWSLAPSPTSSSPPRRRALDPLRQDTPAPDQANCGLTRPSIRLRLLQRAQRSLAEAVSAIVADPAVVAQHGLQACSGAPIGELI